MDTTQFEKLKKLKDKGVITDKEFAQEKRKLLDILTSSDCSTCSKNVCIKFWLIILVTIVAFIGVFFLDFGSRLNFACDTSTMRFAEDLINKTYTNFNNTFRLSNPSQVAQSKNYLKCMAKTNFYRDFPEIYYELDHQQDGTILVHVNPYGDKLQQELDKAVKDLEQELSPLLLQLEGEKQ